MFQSHYGIEQMGHQHGKELRSLREQLPRGNSKVKRINLLAFICFLLFSGCAVTPLLDTYIDCAMLNDGVYQGYYKGGPNSVLVEVSIKDQKIIDVVILEHDTLRGKKAEDVIITEILETQSTDVDAVSGATNSSHVIINAVQIALEKASQERI